MLKSVTLKTNVPYNENQTELTKKRFRIVVILCPDTYEVVQVVHGRRFSLVILNVIKHLHFETVIVFF